MSHYHVSDELPEEHTNAELVQQLRTAYPVALEEERALARIRERLLKQRQERLVHRHPLRIVPQPQLIPPQQSHAGPRAYPIFVQPARPWRHLVDVVAALLVIALLTGSFALVFSLAKSHSGQSAVPPEHVKNGVLLSSGQRLSMFTDQVGWAIGGLASPDSNTPGTWNSVLHTSDGGKHWRIVTPPGSASSPDIGNIYVLDEMTAWMPFNPVPQNGESAKHFLRRTIDGGQTWQTFPWPDQNAGIGNMTFIDSAHGWLLSSSAHGWLSIGSVSLMDVSPNPTSLLRTNDGGKTWQTIDTLALPNQIMGLRFLTQQRGWITACPTITTTPQRSCDLSITNDGGKSWQKQPLPTPQGIPAGARPQVDLSSLTFFSAQGGAMLAYLAGQEYVYTTQNGGQTWQVSGAGLKNTSVWQILDGQHLVGITTNDRKQASVSQFTLLHGGWVKTADYFVGENINDIPEVRFGSLQVGIALRPSAQHRFDVYQTTDNGTTWHKISVLPSSM
jgi:hypothetical protein